MSWRVDPVEQVPVGFGLEVGGLRRCTGPHSDGMLPPVLGGGAAGPAVGRDLAGGHAGGTSVCVGVPWWWRMGCGASVLVGRAGCSPTRAGRRTAWSAPVSGLPSKRRVPVTPSSRSLRNIRGRCSRFSQRGAAIDGQPRGSRPGAAAGSAGGQRWRRACRAARAADRRVVPAQQRHGGDREDRQQRPRGEHGQHHLEPRDPDAAHRPRGPSRPVPSASPAQMTARAEPGAPGARRAAGRCGAGVAGLAAAGLAVARSAGSGSRQALPHPRAAVRRPRRAAVLSACRAARRPRRAPPATAEMMNTAAVATTNTQANPSVRMPPVARMEPGRLPCTPFGCGPLPPRPARRGCAGLPRRRGCRRRDRADGERAASRRLSRGRAGAARTVLWSSCGSSPFPAGR